MVVEKGYGAGLVAWGRCDGRRGNELQRFVNVFVIRMAMGIVKEITGLQKQEQEQNNRIINR